MKKEMAPKKIKVVIVDDHPIVRQGLQQLIDGEPDLEVCGEAEDGSQALRLVEKFKPDLLILDISIKGASGIELLKNVKAIAPDVSAIVVSMHDESLYAERALR